MKLFTYQFDALPEDCEDCEYDVLPALIAKVVWSEVVAGIDGTVFVAGFVLESAVPEILSYLADNDAGWKGEDSFKVREHSSTSERFARDMGAEFHIRYLELMRS